MNIRGCGTALVTPFRYDGSVDEPALRDLIGWQIESGIDFLVSCGTTGEAPTLSHKEWLRVVDITIEVVAGRVPIVVGATSNCTREAIEKSRVAAERAGVDAILSASPYYNKPTQEGQYQHFRAIAQAIKKPIILYNVPGRTAANLEPATLARLARISNIIGVKEASGNMSQIVEGFQAVPPQFLVFSGDDSLTLPIMGLGGAGVISVASNEIPREMAELTRAALNNDWDTARRIHRRYLPLMNANFIESNPLPVKATLAMMGKIREVYRLPLVRMKEDTRARLQKIVSEAGLPVQPETPRPERGRRDRGVSAPAAQAASPNQDAASGGITERVPDRGSEGISVRESGKIPQDSSEEISKGVEAVSASNQASANSADAEAEASGSGEKPSALESPARESAARESAEDQPSEEDNRQAEVAPAAHTPVQDRGLRSDSVSPEKATKRIAKSDQKQRTSKQAPASESPEIEVEPTVTQTAEKSVAKSEHTLQAASEQTVRPPEPAAQPTEPAAQPPEPAAQPTEPAAQPTEPAAQPPEPLAFYVYESWQAGPRRTILHRSSCNSYRNGRGRTGSPDAAYAHWHGPYPTVQEARNISRGLQGVLIRSECKCVPKK
jgi:4-hydroxy-tetrahydrodipicolinate synthase